MLDIILRTCSRKESQVHGGKERIHPKEEILLKCCQSLINSIEECQGKFGEIKLIIVDDHSDSNIVKQLKQISNKFITLKNTGNSASIHKIYDYAIKNSKDLIYFVEDDYLHEPTAIKEMLDFYHLSSYMLQNNEIVIYPLDGNDRYKPQYLKPSFIVPGERRYWRTIDSTTGTFLLSKNLFLKYFEIFNQFADYGVNPMIHEETTINTIWRQPGISCFSPIPTLVYHLQLIEHLPLYTNYKILWDSIKI